MARRPSPTAPVLANALIALNAAPMGRASVCRLAVDAEAWIGAPEADGARLAAELGIPAATYGRARAAVQTASAVAATERQAAAALGARILTWLDDDYPATLRHLPLPPPVLYCRGVLPAALANGGGAAVAIVGSRHPSTYGREAAWLFGRDLARAGV